MNVTKDLCVHDKTFKSQVAPVVNRAKYTSEQIPWGFSRSVSLSTRFRKEHVYFLSGIGC